MKNVWMFGLVVSFSALGQVTCEDAANKILTGWVAGNNDLQKYPTSARSVFSFYGLNGQPLPQLTGDALKNAEDHRPSVISNFKTNKLADRPAESSFTLTPKPGAKVTSSNNGELKVSSTLNPPNEWIITIANNTAAELGKTNYILTYENNGGKQNCSLKKISTDNLFYGRKADGSNPSKDDNDITGASCKANIATLQNLITLYNRLDVMPNPVFVKTGKEKKQLKERNKVQELFNAEELRVRTAHPEYYAFGKTWRSTFDKCSYYVPLFDAPVRAADIAPEVQASEIIPATVPRKQRSNSNSSGSQQ